MVPGEGEGGARRNGESIERQALRDSGRGARTSFQTAGVSAASPHEDDRQGENAEKEDRMEEKFRRVCG